jgi:hypothetical protein
MSHFAEALVINREISDPRGIAGSLIYLGIIIRMDGDVETARGYLLDSLGISTEIQFRRGRAIALYELGALERDAGNYVASRGMIGEALTIFNETGNRHGQADCYLNLAKIDVSIHGGPRIAAVCGCRERACAVYLY